MDCLLTRVLFFTAAVVEPRPAAMVLRVEGDVAVRPADGRPRRTPGVMDLLYPLDQMVAAPGSVATVVFQWDGHRERIQASSCATIACNECTPAGITELRRAVHAAVVAKGKKIRPLARSGRGAAVEVR